MNMTTKKRGYYVNLKDEGIGIAIVATSTQEAKRLGWQMLCLDGEYINLRARIVTDEKSVEDLPIGIVNSRLALRRGLYVSLSDEKCEICGAVDYVTFNSIVSKIICDDCMEKIEKI